MTFVKKIREVINNIDYLSKDELHKLLIAFNDTEVDFPHDVTLADLFAEQVKRTPNKIALIFKGKELTKSANIQPFLTGKFGRFSWVNFLRVKGIFAKSIFI